MLQQRPLLPILTPRAYPQPRNPIGRPGGDRSKPARARLKRGPRFLYARPSVAIRRLDVEGDLSSILLAEDGEP